jgi:hypothetical protein
MPEDYAPGFRASERQIEEEALSPPRNHNALLACFLSRYPL